MTELVIATFEGEQLLRVNLAGRDLLTLGRSERCDVRLHGADVSRHHAVLAREGNQWLLINLSAARGMYDNERPIDATFLHPDRPIRIGRVYLWYTGPAACDPVSWPDPAATCADQPLPAVA